jgi:hypothetical protein
MLFHGRNPRYDYRKMTGHLSEELERYKHLKVRDANLNIRVLANRYDPAFEPGLPKVWP